LPALGLPHAAAEPSGPRGTRAREHGQRPRAGLDGENGVVPLPITGKPPTPLQFDQAIGAQTEALKQSRSKDWAIALCGNRVHRLANRKKGPSCRARAF